MKCQLNEICSGCSWIHFSDEDQVIKKTQVFTEQMQLKLGGAQNIKVEFIKTQPFRTRDRADLVIENTPDQKQKIGLFSQKTQSILDMPECPQMTKKLEEFLIELRKIQFPIRKGSIRIRVSTEGEFGVWLDFANLDVKHLLEEKTTLLKLLKIAHVEIGQKRKTLVLMNNELKLADPVLKKWFQTYSQNAPIPLLSNIASFTQTGFLTNQALVEAIEENLKSLKLEQIVEFGSGIGNFSIPLSHHCKKLDCYEVDQESSQAFQKTLDLKKTPTNIQIHVGDYQKRSEIDFSKTDLIFVNPPRSGLKEFLSPLENQATRPTYLMYMSCFLDALIEDGQRLEKLGYRLISAKIIDQFPQTPHFETLTLWHYQA